MLERERVREREREREIERERERQGCKSDPRAKAHGCQRGQLGVNPVSKLALRLALVSASNVAANTCAGSQFQLSPLA